MTETNLNTARLRAQTLQDVTRPRIHFGAPYGRMNAKNRTMNPVPAKTYAAPEPDTAPSRPTHHT